ncbi:MAG TPA: sigma-70 family RNA polymerase sigma factor [Thermoanaerobaculia bacterium]|nr:sigma-70 family RNA polymerase sigma factor [Thermoanaerobaculia bacterium]
MNQAELHSDRGEITDLLSRWHQGEGGVPDRLVPLVYGELRRLAARALAGERADHTLEPTALVHEAYLRLSAGRAPAFADRVHFFAVAARMMRRILVDHARSLRAVRRGKGGLKLSLEDVEPPGVEACPLDILALDEALTELARRDPRKARVVELRFFGGLSVQQVAETLGVSVPTVILDTRLARAWMFSRLAMKEGTDVAG